MRAFDCIERPLALFFYRYGAFVCKNPLPFIVFPLLIAATMSLGFLHLDSVTDAIYLFTPEGAPSKMERQAIHNLWPLHEHNYIPGRAVTQLREIQVTVTAKDDGNILEKHYAHAIDRLDKFIQHRVKATFEGKTYMYSDLCLQWRNEDCPGNKHVQIISDLYDRGFNITYPIFRLGNVNGYLGSSLGGLTLSRSNGKDIVVGARSWMMVYHLKFYPDNTSYISGLWEKDFEKNMKAYPEDPFIDITFFHSQTLAEELKRNADSLVPLFVFSFTMLVLFSVLCSMTTMGNTFYFDWVVSKPVLAVLGVLNTGMGIVTSIGFLNLTGIPYCDIVGVMPFLVVAVGIDNMFLMLAAVRSTNRAHDPSIRVGECMSDAAVSMLITSLTDAFSFGVGAITSIPAVRIFCIYTCLALALTYIYQITFFAGLLSLWIKSESKGQHSVLFTATVPADRKENTRIDKLLYLGSRADLNASNLKANIHYSAAQIFFRDWFGPVLVDPVVRGLVAVWFCIYLGFGIYGCTQIREGLEPVNLLVADSYAIPHYRTLEEYFWHYGSTVQVVVNNPPDLRDPVERQRVEQMVHEFANTDHSMGDEAVQFWLKEMRLYYEHQADDTQLLLDTQIFSLAEHFFGVKPNDRWEHDVVWGEMKDGSKGVTAFRFVIGMKEISKTRDQQEATFMFRDVAARYPSYNVTTFMPLWLFTDQYALVIPNTIQNIVIALSVMIVIAVALIPQPMCSIWVALAIGSIDIGVIGFMTLWDVNLDAISMITIIMSIGFSVDYAAHITYGYVSSKEPTPAGRICAALGHLGWPLTQGALSTIIAVGVLATVPAYMIVTFFKTVFLAIVIGLIHGLIFLPVALSVFVRGSCILG
uniref:SSD domain-containing protein n=1 Tax=Steinernema glaseri TaxID=37863 RepID=A0A1I7ZA38_9BILA